MKHSHWLIVYDIRDPRRLRKVEKIVSSYGERIQQSIFHSDFSFEIMKKVVQQLNRILDSSDSLLIIPLCKRDWQEREYYGILKKLEDLGFQIF